jgi:undecaprenyl-diphosphatase
MVMDTPKSRRRNAIVMVTAVCAFTVIATLVENGRAATFDSAVRAEIHGWSRPWLTATARWWTYLGDAEVLWPVGMLAAFWLGLARRSWEAKRFAIAVVSANLVDEAIKLGFHRPRPKPWFGIPVPWTFSFPSGHSFISCVFYLLLAASVVHADWASWHRRGVWLAALLLILSIGFTRVYLGVHYPTDVLAGYLAAIAWLAGVGLAGNKKRGPVARSPS